MAGQVVVTGASGFVGRALVGHLAALGRPVAAVARRQADWPAGVRPFLVARYDHEALDRLLPGAAAVVHLAAHAHRPGDPEDFEASVRVAAVVADAARRARVPRLVFMSSIGVNGSTTQDVPFTEASAPAPAEAYGVAKLQAEQAVSNALQGSATAYVIVRPPLIHGPGAPGNFAALLHAVRSGLPLPLGGIHNARTFLGIDNLMGLLTLCLEHPAAANELFLAGDAQDLSTPELVRCIAAGLGRPARLLPLPGGLLERLLALGGRRRLSDSVCGSLQIDASKAIRQLGWQPVVTAAEGVRRAAAAWPA